MGPGKLDYGSWVSIQKEYILFSSWNSSLQLVRPRIFCTSTGACSKCGSQPVTQSTSLYVGSLSHHQDYRNSHTPHTWPVVSLFLSLQAWPSFTATWPTVDFLGEKMSWKWHRGKVEETEEQAGLEEAIDRGEVRVKQSPGLEDELSQGDSASFRVSTADQRGSFEQCRLGGKF